MRNAQEVVEKLLDDNNLEAYHSRYGRVWPQEIASGMRRLYFLDDTHHSHNPVPLRRGNFVIGTHDEIQEHIAIQKGYL